MRLAWAFFKRDAIIALSYRAAFVVQLAGNLLLLGLFYFMAKTVGGQNVPSLTRYGGNFLAFLLIGIALTDCVGVSLTTFASQIREAQTTGTLEVTLMAPVSLPVMLILSSLWNYFFSSIRFFLYLIFGALLYGVSLGNANVPAAAVIFLLTVLSFMGLGILWAGVVMVVKRGETMMTAMAYVVLLVSGVLFPTAMLPAWLQTVAAFIPLTPALEGMRLALLRGASLAQVWPMVAQLAAFAVVLMAVGIAGFNQTVRVAKRAGSLAQF